VQQALVVGVVLLHGHGEEAASVVHEFAWTRARNQSNSANPTKQRAVGLDLGEEPRRPVGVRLRQLVPQTPSMKKGNGDGGEEGSAAAGLGHRATAPAGAGRPGERGEEGGDGTGRRNRSTAMNPNLGGGGERLKTPPGLLPLVGLVHQPSPSWGK
jgi:hypothetical protein